jgi:SARP family transcriptional regulator, regulator of embCAB operon
MARLPLLCSKTGETGQTALRGTTVRYTLLGPLEVVTDEGRCISFTASKATQVLALLLTRCGQTVTVETIIEELWGDQPPTTAMPTLQTYVYHLRRRLRREGANGAELLATRSRGYEICVEPEQVDEKVFERLVECAGAQIDHDPEAALKSVTEALVLWRGPALASVHKGEVLAAHVTRLEEMRARAESIRIQAKRSLGRHHEIVPELRSLVARYPLNESLHAWLIEALYRSGRRAEALGAYRDLWSRLDVELGVAPSREAQLLQRAILELDDVRVPARARRKG